MQTQLQLSRVNADKFFPCQQIAARSRNGAVDALESHDTGALAFRYLNNRYQQRAFRRNAIIGALVPVIGWTYSGVNTHNALRCRASKRACKEALQKQVPPRVFAQLRQERHAYNKMVRILKKAQVDTTEAKRLHQSHGRSAKDPATATWS